MENLMWTDNKIFEGERGLKIREVSLYTASPNNNEFNFEKLNWEMIEKINLVFMFEN